MLFSPVDSRRLGSGLPPCLALPSRDCSLRGWTAESTRPLVLRSRVTSGINDNMAGPESSPAYHRLRLWGLVLGSASPCADCHGAGTLGLSVAGVFTLLARTHSGILTSPRSTPWFPPGLHRTGNAPLPLCLTAQDHASVGRLIPTILGAFPLDW